MQIKKEEDSIGPSDDETTNKNTIYLKFKENYFFHVKRTMPKGPANARQLQAMKATISQWEFSSDQIFTVCFFFVSV